MVLQRKILWKNGWFRATPILGNQQLLGSQHQAGDGSRLKSLGYIGTTVFDHVWYPNISQYVDTSQYWDQTYPNISQCINMIKHTYFRIYCRTSIDQSVLLAPHGTPPKKNDRREQNKLTHNRSRVPSHNVWKITISNNITVTEYGSLHRFQEALFIGMSSSV